MIKKLVISVLIILNINIVNAGDIDRNTETKSVQSHYFITFDNTLTENLYKKISTLNYHSKNNTIGPKSISKQELIKEFNKLF